MLAWKGYMYYELSQPKEHHKATNAETYRHCWQPTSWCDFRVVLVAGSVCQSSQATIPGESWQWVSRQQGAGSLDVERIVIAGVINISVLAVEGERVKIGITAPPDVTIVREELLRTPAEVVEGTKQSSPVQQR